MNRNWIGGTLLTLGLLGCGSQTPPPDLQKLKVFLTDAPLADATAVNIVLNGLEVTGDNGQTLTFASPRVINLLELRNGVRTELGEVDALTDGQQLRLLMDGQAEVVFLDGSSKVATVPSGAQTGVKIVNLPADAEEITLDFDAEKSIHETGNGKLIMRPTIRAMAGERPVGDSEGDGSGQTTTEQHGDLEVIIWTP